MRTAKELFEELNAQDENVSLEAKGAHEVGRTVLESVCAFANEPDLGGGYILIGASRDDSQLFPTYAAEDIGDTDKIQADLATQCNSMFNIPLRPRMRLEEVNGKNVLVVQIDELSPSQKPVHFKSEALPGATYRRIGSTDHRCSEDDLRLFYSETDAYDRSVMKRTSLLDVDEQALKQYRILRANVNPAAKELSYTDQDLLLSLGSLDPISRQHLTVAGLLLFGSRAAQRRELPMTRADYIRVSGTEWVKDPDDRFRTTDMRGPLISLMFRLVDEVNADLPKGFMLQEGELQADSTGLPVKALREVIVNALMHRNYKENSPIQVIRYDNRLEIRNPGYSLKSEDLLGEPGSSARNPSIAAVFHETNLAETKGSGIRAMRGLLKQAHLAPPTFESDRGGNQFTAHLLLHHFLSDDDLTWLAGFEQFDLNDDQKQALIMVRELGAINNPSYRQFSESDTLRATRDLRQLCEFDLLQKKGKKRGAYYIAGAELSNGPRSLSTEPSKPNTEPHVIDIQAGMPKNTEPSSLSTEPNLKTEELKSKTELQEEIPTAITELIKGLKQRESDTEKVQHIIFELCSIRAYDLSQLSKILSRGEDYISRKYIRPMIAEGKLNYRYPEVVNHPQQSYKAIKQ